MKNIISKLSLLLVAWSLLVVVETNLPAQPTAFIYQGMLKTSNAPANGNYDFSFTIYDAAASGNAVGAALTNTSVAVTNGLFLTTLDFGSSAFTGANRWLEIGVRTNGSLAAFSILTSRQALVSTPYAIQSLGALTATTATSATSLSGSLSTTQLSGTIADVQLSTNVAKLNGSANFSGTVTANGFAGNSAGLTNLPAANLTGTIPDARLSSSIATLRNDTVPFLLGSFNLVQSPVVGNSPRSVTSADVNGDGRVDLISGNEDHTISVLTNNGNGVFTLAQTLSIGIPYGVKAADVNGDGRMDLIYADVIANTLPIFTNNGSGVFTLSQSPAVGANPESVTVADVNGDGRADLISANYSVNTLSVLTNNGSGVFTLKQSPPTGSSPYSVTAADVNGDGRMDLISANNGSSTLSVLTNNGSGIFTLTQSPATGSSPYSVTAADVNGDGRMDLISANSGSSTLTVLTNNGSGVFTLAQSPATGSQPLSVAAADLNGDGRVDLISANNGPNTLSVLTNNGGGVFTVAQSLTTGSGPFSVTTADLNGDGRVDLVSANEGGNTLSVFLGTPVPITQLFQGANTFANSSNNFVGNTYVGNTYAGNSFSGSNFLGGTMGLRSTNPLALLEINGGAASDGSGDLKNIAFGWAGPGNGFRHWIRSRHNSFAGDGNAIDFFLNTSTSASGSSEPGTGNLLTLTLNNGKVGIGTNSPATALHVIGTVTGTAFSGNGAALTSLAPANLTAGTAAINISGTAASAGNLSGSLPASQISGTLNASQIPNLDANKITSGVFTGNASGLTNLNAANLTNTIADARLPSNVALLNGSRLLGPFTLVQSPVTGVNPHSVTAADVNGDGWVDLISANTGAATLGVQINNGSGGFTLAQSPALGSSPYCVVAADVNGDGRVDLISANALADTLSVVTNNGSGFFTLAQSPVVGSKPYSVTAADVNGDGRIDLISANAWANTLSILTNNGSGVFTLAQSPAVASFASFPYFVTAADVNGDGRIDLISANSAPNILSVLTNNGSGFFTRTQSLAVGLNPLFVTAADVNGDGWIDLISANSATNTLSVATNDGSGFFTLAQSPVVEFSPYSVTAADVNGDGWIDLISANSATNTLSVLTNNGHGFFSLAQTPVGGTLPYSVTAADVNRDGRVDLISANSGDGTLSVLLGTRVPQVFQDVTAFINSGNTFVGSFTGNATTATTAANVTGNISDAQLSANIPQLNGMNVFTGTNRFSGVVIVTNANNQLAGTFTGNGAGVTNLSPANLSPGMAAINISGNAATATTAANVTGNISDAQLSANIARLNGTNVFSGTNRFSGVAIVTNVNNQLTGTFSGNGTAITNVNAATLGGSASTAFASVSGSPNYLQNQTAVDQSASFRVTGNGLFNGGKVGIGASNTPLAMLEITAGADNVGNSDGKAIALAYSGGGYRHWIRSRHNSGAALGNAMDFFTSTGGTAAASSAPGTGNTLALTVNGGRVGVGGIFDPVSPLHIKAEADGGSFNGIRVESAASTEAWNIGIWSSDLTFRYGTGGSYGWFSHLNGAVGSGSDRRLKKDIEPLGAMLEKLMALNPVSYRFTNQTDEAVKSFGFIAQEVEPLFPEFVTEKDGMKGLTYSSFIPVAVAAIQEQQRQLVEKNARITALENEVTSLKQQNAATETRLQKIEDALSR